MTLCRLVDDCPLLLLAYDALDHCLLELLLLSLVVVLDL